MGQPGLSQNISAMAVSVLKLGVRAIEEAREIINKFFQIPLSGVLCHFCVNSFFR